MELAEDGGASSSANATPEKLRNGKAPLLPSTTTKMLTKEEKSSSAVMTVPIRIAAGTDLSQPEQSQAK
jgi:hypothetical protein